MHSYCKWADARFTTICCVEVIQRKKNELMNYAHQIFMKNVMEILSRILFLTFRSVFFFHSQQFNYIFHLIILSHYYWWFRHTRETFIYIRSVRSSLDKRGDDELFVVRNVILNCFAKLPLCFSSQLASSFYFSSHFDSRREQLWFLFSVFSSFVCVKDSGDM